MNPQRWQQIEALFTRAQELPAEERKEFVRREAGDDDELARKVLRMLDAPTDRPKLIEPPTLDDGDGAPRAPAIVEIGDFELLAELGRGGMGVVYRARQRSLEREVALKVLHASPTLTARQIERFGREAKSLALLRHPRVVDVFAVGEHGETRYIAMELVHGRDLAKEIKRLRDPSRAGEGGLPPFDSDAYLAAAASVVERVADTLAFSHRNGVIHRDVKPSNILLDVSGEVRIVDFGLARDERMGTITEHGEVAGTWAYMSPEQVLASLHSVDQRTDVYSLGVVLYELLSLHRPFDGPTSQVIMNAIVHDEPPRLRSHNPRVPRDLELVCQTAMARSLRDRYAGAAEFRDDLRRFLAHQAVRATPPSIAERARRFVVKHRTSFVLAGGVLAALVIGLAIAARNERSRTWAQRRGVFEHVLARDDWSTSIDELVDANALLRQIEKDGDTMPSDVADLARELDARFAADRKARVARGRALLASGRAGRVDDARFGSFSSPPSERELADALLVFADARAIYRDDAEIAQLADVRSSFPRVSIGLAPQTLAAVPRVAEAHAFLRAIDSVACTIGDAVELGALPIENRAVAPGYWRIVVEIPEYGRAEMTRLLLPREAAYSFTARVLPDAQVVEGMREIPGGRFVFRKDSPLGCACAGDGADYESYWIAEAETSNREYLTYLRESGDPPPAPWVRLGFQGDWRSLPLGDDADRWLDLPATGLTLYEMTAYAEWYGKRLPTHIELERALRGPDALFEPWEGLASEDLAGRFNIDRADVGSEKRGEAGRFEIYWRCALQVRADGYRQLPSGLFHAYGNVAEVTESMAVEPQLGMLVESPWERITLGSAWNARDPRVPQSLAVHAINGAGDAYTRFNIGMRCAKTAPR